LNKIIFGGMVMLGIGLIKKDIKLKGRSKEGRPIEMLLAALCVFSKQGKDEVSLSELQESIAEFQREFQTLGYTYSSRFLYSFDILDDLKELYFNSSIRQYNYRHDSFLPKRFLALTRLGKGRGTKILDRLSEDEMENLTSAVAKAIENHELRWRLWARQ